MSNESDGQPCTSQPAGDKSKKRLSVERIYQKKTQLEHILLRPDTYIGSVERVTQQAWIVDQENQVMIQKEVSFVPGLFKIFDEILVNAADNKQRDSKMSCIKIDINKEENMIRIWNNGKGIPVVHHNVENMYVPTLVFGHLLTSSNYDDTERKVTGGRNGYGGKLCNIFSKRFIVETFSKEYNKGFKQEWRDNMTKTSEPKISPYTVNEDYTCVTFYPDLEKFKMTELEADTVDIFARRAYDVAASTNGLKIFLNGKKLPVNGFKDYVQFYLKNQEDESGNPLKVVYERISDRWEVAIAPSATGFQQVSFVNSIATTKGGRHVDYIADQITAKLSEVVKKKSGKGTAVQVKPFQIKNHLWVFVNCLIENPTFDSQTKENMTLQSKSFGSVCNLGEKFVTQVSKCGIVESILSWMKYKAMEKMDKQCSKAKKNKLKGIPKLDDANDAGGKNSHLCTLILTEGDSAKSLAVAGLGVVGRDRYGVFPLRGKVLNVREATQKQIMENAEINNLIKILGLQYKQKYDNQDSIKSLRYGKVMIMTDQDQDGSHIKGLLINFIHHNWPHLLRQGFLEEFITPIVKVFKKTTELSFYSLPEYDEWRRDTRDWHTYRIKYYKGLGTSSSKEAKEYFSDMARHRIRFHYAGPQDDHYIQLAFAKNKADQRKDWLTNFMEERKRRLELNLPEEHLYNEQVSSISYADFVNQELILFSNMDNERSIPSLVDGFKPGQRKVMFTCFKRNLIKEIKVAQLAGSVAEMSAYHHGETSLQSTIVGLAQDYVGSNNINLLMPNGQFGTRLNGGKDAASPRYIFTQLSPLARALFRPEDDPLLKYLKDDNQRIEPEWYLPIIPMVLVNGAEGIGTGWSTKIPNYNVVDILNNVRRMLDEVPPLKMKPSFRGFRGSIEEIDTNRFVVHGEIAILDAEKVEITELPVRTWTQNYKESVLEPMSVGTDKVPAVIQDYKEYHTDTTVRFVVKMLPGKLAEAQQQGLHKYFKLSTTITANSMVLFDSLGCVRRFDDVLDMFKEYFALRLKWYEKRKNYMEGMLSAECLKLENQARFVMEKIENKISIENRAKKELVKNLITARYDSDPVKAWKESIDRIAAIEEARDLSEENEDNNESNSAGNDDDNQADFNYILGMPLWSLTKEKKEALLAERDKKRAELGDLRSKSIKQLWRDDLDHFEKELKAFETKIKNEEQEAIKKKAAQMVKGAKKGAGRSSGVAAANLLKEVMPSQFAERVVPVIDPELMKKIDASKRKKTNKDNKDDKDYMFTNIDEDPDLAEPKPLAQRLSEQFNLTVEKKPLTIVDMEKKKGTKAVKTGVKRPPAGGSKKAGGPSSPKKAGGKNKKEAWEISSDDEDSDFAPNESNSPRRENHLPRRAAAVKAVTKGLCDSVSEKSDDEDQEVKFHDVDHGQGNRPIVISEDSDSKEQDEFKAPSPKKETEKAEKGHKLGPPPARANSVRGGRGGSRGASSSGTSRKPSNASSSVSRKPSGSVNARGGKSKQTTLNFQPVKSTDGDADSEEMEVAPVVRAARPKAAPKYAFDSDGESSDDNEKPLVKKATKRKKKGSSDDDDFNPAALVKKKGKNVVDSDSDF